MSGFKGPSYPVSIPQGQLTIDPLQTNLINPNTYISSGPFPVGDSAGISFLLDGTGSDPAGQSVTLRLVWSNDVWTLPLDPNAIMSTALGVAEYTAVSGPNTILRDFQSHRGPWLYILYLHPGLATWYFRSTFVKQPVIQPFLPEGQWNNTPVVVGGATASVTWTVPANEIWEVLSAQTTFTTSGTAGNREVLCTLNNETPTRLAIMAAGKIHVASLAFDYLFATGLGSLVIPALTGHFAAPFLFSPSFLYPGWQVVLTAEGAKAGDAFSSYILAYRVQYTLGSTRGLT
jgi:hypothetical protein